MKIKHQRSPFVIVAVAVSGAALILMSSEERYVAVPGLLCLIMTLWLWLTLWDRDGKLPLFDVGMICALATLVYTVLPLLNYWVGGLSFGPFSDARLQAYRISPRELGLFHFRHVLYAFSFILAYAALRGKRALKTGNTRLPSPSARHVIVLMFLLLTGYFAVLQLTMGVNFNTSYAPEAFNEYLAVIGNLPLPLLQVSTKLGGILFIFKLALLYLVVARCRHARWRVVLWAWIAAEIIQTIAVKGARTGLVLFLFAAVLFYHRMIKPLTIKLLVPLGALVFFGFLYLGVYRSYSDIAEMQADILNNDASVLSTTNEFQALLGTSYDVLQRKARGVYLPWYLYFNDFVTILPPQQIMPIEKVSASEWYLREIGLSGTGLGLMWGVISQSIIGLDWLELAVRGAILGFLLASFHRWYVDRQVGFVETVIYAFICVKVYYTFRDTTLSLLANVVWEILPFILIVRIGTAVLSRRKRAVRPNGAAAG